MRFGGCSRRGHRFCTAFGAEKTAFLAMSLCVLRCGWRDGFVAAEHSRGAFLGVVSCRCGDGLGGRVFVAKETHLGIRMN